MPTSWCCAVIRSNWSRWSRAGACCSRTARWRSRRRGSRRAIGASAFMATNKKPHTRKKRIPAAVEDHVPPLKSVPARAKGSLLIIGGNENKAGHTPILEELASRVGRGKLVVATFASEEPEEQWEQYRKVFSELGVRRITHLDARTRDDLIAEPQIETAE